MAEARSAVSELRVGRIDEGRSPEHDFYLAIRASIIRRFFRARNLLVNGMWPTSVWNLCTLVLVLSVLYIGDWELFKSITSRMRWLEATLYISQDWPAIVRGLLISCLAGFVFFLILLYVRRYLLRALLSYRGWMYEQPKTQSTSTILWAFVVRLVGGNSPLLYGCQQSLPRLNVPPLKDTLKGLIQSLKPLYGDDSEIIQTLKKESKEFERNLGQKLQRILYLKSWWSPNYVSDWWEKYVYLMSRSPLPINSNYYIMDQCRWIPTSCQTARAASVAYHFFLIKQKIDREQIQPLFIRNTIPLCMAQYERVFSTTRIPGEDCDTLIHYSSAESKHVVVFRKGLMYKLDMFDAKRKLITPRNLQRQLDWIIEDADNHQDEASIAGKNIPSLTGLDRTSWAKARKEFFSDGVNKESLDAIEKSVFCINLETSSFSDFSSRGKFLLHGDGSSIWFDKSLSMIFFSDGHMGLNCEHSYADAPVVAHVIEFSMTQEAIVGPFCSAPIDEIFRKPDQPLSNPQRLVWDVFSKLAPVVRLSNEFVIKNLDDLDLCISEYTRYGKGFIKTCKVSPDAYIQMALQVTYFKDAGKFALTYESSMTRLYLHGRTETVRSLTLEGCDFVRAFLDKNVSKQEQIHLLQKACEVHQQLYKDSMTGKGIDRHLFALYVVSKGLEYDCEFLKKAISIPWTLSTSQQPQQQIATSPNCDLPQYKDMVSPGGGFGPVSDDGYGVSYMIPGDFKFFFHVSSKKSVDHTDSSIFMKLLFETLDQMQDLFDKDH
ncbi:hypothetical protein CHS0354_038035 [Potamilus streckersoni]|uniref:Choline/carnitine acyltransferase domain-containing protein n=1 Tax=Potamilus streckersoni TaxID=2493646 RepID=A0AAE0VZQ7_9BIVA|nr:hypothetical protein CHS0354_038035 [Potamilus streckersoni]